VATRRKSAKRAAKGSKEPGRREARRLPRSEPLHRYLLDAVEQAVIATDLSGTVVFVNKFAERLYGWSASEAVGQSVVDLVPSDLGREEASQSVQRMSEGERFSGERVLRRHDGSAFEAQITTSPILDSKGRQVGIAGLSTDVSARKQAERRREAQYAVTRSLAESATLAETVPALLGAVGRGMGWDVGVMWMVDWNAEVLRCVDVWRASPDRFHLFEELSRRTVFPSGVNFCGRIWAEGTVVWTSDFAETLGPTRAMVAANEGLRAAIGFPVRAARGVIGVVTFYGADIREPDSDLRSMLHAIGTQIGLFTERREADRLETSIGQLRALSQRLVAVREEERARVSREFHDELGQSLTGLKLDLAWVGRHLATLKTRAPKIRDKVREMTAQVDTLIQSARQLITEMRPRVLDELGLIAAVEWQTQDFRRRSGTRCELTVEVPDLKLDDSRSTAVFRILQEILTNVTRHAAATEVAVAVRKDVQHLLVEVHDNGRGMTETERDARTSIGLLGMRERAHACNGTIVFSGSPGKGTTVTLRIPLENGSH
jgi:PAS domain S-box-containing protein